MSSAIDAGPVRPRPPVPYGRLAVRLPGHLPGPAALALLPWLTVLAACGETWWVVLDALEFTALATTHVLLGRRHPAARRTAAAAAVLLCADALADVWTAAPGVALVSALAMALCIELPLAAACVALARSGDPAAQASTSHRGPARLACPRRVVAPGTGGRAPWISGSAGAARLRRYPAGVLVSRTSWPVTAVSSPAIR